MSDLALTSTHTHTHTEKYLFRGLVEGHRGVDQLESILHLQHELLPVGRYALGTVSDQVHVVVVGLEQSLRLLLNLQGTLVGFLQRGSRGLELTKCMSS